MIVSDRRALLEICGRLAMVNAPHLPLFSAAAEGRIGLAVFAGPAAPWPTKTMEGSTRPTVVLISDDPEIGTGEALGPDAWACARRARWWGRRVLVHGAAGAPEHYRAAVGVAERVGRVIFVETSGAMAPAWRQLFAPLHPVMILPSGGVHPVLPPMGARH